MPEAASRTETAADADEDRSWLSDPVRRAKWLELVMRDELDMDEEDARMITGVVLDQFGDKRELLDDELPSDVRSIFYTLESKRILTFRRIEYENEEGATLRGFFWRLHADRIKQHVQAAGACDEDDQELYDELPASCWQRSAA